ncbi:MAG: DUF1684 domain-containing protein [Vicinamibacterales bacterium]
MRARHALIALSATLVAAVSGACRNAPPPAADVSPEEARAQTEAWRAKHEADYRRDYASIAGLHFLSPGAHTAGSAAGSDIVLPGSAPATLGRFVLEGEAVRFEPAAGVSVTLKDQPVTAPVVLVDDGAPKADELKVGDVRMVIHRSGTRKSLRVWDPNGKEAMGFLGFRWFDIQPAYRVVGRFIPDGTPRTVTTVNTFGDEDPYTTEGVVEFTLHGETLRLRPFTTRPKRFYFVIRDASSGKETYAAARFLYADLRDDGTTVLDFNQAYNPPCAFNPFTTCPLPLPENRMPVKVLAGERAYPRHVELPRS